eukprot:6412246-Prymnesium_polylepis.1
MRSATGECPRTRRASAGRASAAPLRFAWVEPPRRRLRPSAGSSGSGRAHTAWLRIVRRSA